MYEGEGEWGGAIHFEEETGRQVHTVGVCHRREGGGPECVEERERERENSISDTGRITLGMGHEIWHFETSTYRLKNMLCSKLMSFSYKTAQSPMIQLQIQPNYWL